MSFYGSIYYQVAQSFAKILFKNSGWDSKQFLSNKPVNGSVEADSRTGVFGIDSGNRWIQIQPDNEGCKIWHSAPSLTSPTVIQGIEKSESPPAPSSVTELASGDYFKVPVIRYDDAGHILPASQEAVYYRMPVIDIVSDINNLEDAVDKLENTSGEMDKSIKTNAQNINLLKDQANTLEDTLGDFRLVTDDDSDTICEVIGNMDVFRTLLEDEDVTLSQAHLNLKDYVENQVGTLAASIQGLVQTTGLLSENIKTLQEKVTALENKAN